jgi:hypothetical protein
MISEEDLHKAAELVGSFDDDETQIAAYGLPTEELFAFIENSNWFDAPGGTKLELDGASMAMGIAIGVVAAHSVA